MCALSNRAVSVITLGRMGFIAAYDVQMRFAQQHLDELSGRPNTHGENTLLLVEHTPVYTLGLRNNFTKRDELRLKKIGAEFYKTNRAGPITFHGPGQLVAYPILNLHRFKPSLKWYASQLEQTMMSTLKQFGLSGRTTDKTGIWVGNRQIGMIGLHESQGVTTHGMALNCNVNLDWFKHVAPPNQNTEVTSLSKELNQNVEYQDAVKPFLRCFQEVFDCELEYKMLDEKEFTSVAVSSASGKEFEAGSKGLGIPQRAEYGLRHMSTLSTSAHLDGSTSNKMTPMW